MRFPLVKARAHTNIAVVKYWGKANERIILPQNSSLSLTLDRFYTDTEVRFAPQLTHDQIQLNHQRIPEDIKIQSVMNIVRQLMGKNVYANVKSVNHVPTAAGLASSASGLAALAAAASYAAGLKLSRRKLSRLARHGSGSASRSIYGGWVEWQKGHNNRTSYAYPVPHPQLTQVRMIAIVLKKSPKKISSREGMRRCVKTSPYYSAWTKVTAKNLQQAKSAIQQRDFTKLGRVAETNAMRMHALTLSAEPPFTYLTGKTLRVIQMVHHLRAAGLECYYTIDAGPNVKIICQKSDCQLIKRYLSKFFSARRIIISGPGAGVKILKEI